MDHWLKETQKIVRQWQQVEEAIAIFMLKAVNEMRLGTHREEKRQEIADPKPTAAGLDW
jgi:hypothetical protein